MGLIAVRPSFPASRSTLNPPRVRQFSRRRIRRTSRDYTASCEDPLLHPTKPYPSLWRTIFFLLPTLLMIILTLTTFQLLSTPTTSLTTRHTSEKPLKASTRPGPIPYDTRPPSKWIVLAQEAQAKAAAEAAEAAHKVAEAARLAEEAKIAEAKRIKESAIAAQVPPPAATLPSDDSAAKKKEEEEKKEEERKKAEADDLRAKEENARQIIMAMQKEKREVNHKPIGDLIARAAAGIEKENRL